MYDALIGRLGRLGRVLTFDKRGTGLSGHDLGFGSLAERADDIRVVMDAAGWERAHLIGISEGGPLSLLFVASFPERVQDLVLYGSFACLLLRTIQKAPISTCARFLDYVERTWGSGQVLGALSMHSRPGDPRTTGAVERACALPRLAAQIMRSNLAIDARPIVAAISVPTLVIHRADDPIVGIARGRAVATALKNAQFIELAGEMHCGWDAPTGPLRSTRWRIPHRYAGCCHRHRSDVGHGAVHGHCRVDASCNRDR